jgi:DNA-binding PadR family transcriptional regulator
VSQIPDKRRRSDLELFVLALIEDGVSTPYELQQAARLSPGATIPVLRRLLETGLVQTGKAGTRGRAAYRLTAAGRQRLKVGWKELIANGPSSDFDADLRVALLALFVGGRRRLAADFLYKSAARRLESLNSIDEPAPFESPSTLAYQYKSLRAASAKAVIKAGAAAADVVARSLSSGSGIERPRSPLKPLKRA